MAQSFSLHIGKMVHDELRAQRRSVSWLAGEIHCNRSNAYKILERSNIDIELLVRISTALNHNFFADIAAYMQDVIPK